jgi:hypothetical protein
MKIINSLEVKQYQVTMVHILLDHFKVVVGICFCNNSIIVHVGYITIETKEAARIRHSKFLFRQKWGELKCFGMTNGKYIHT